LQLNNTDSQQNAKQNAPSDVTKYWYKGEVQEWASEEGKKKKSGSYLLCGTWSQ